MPSHLPGKGPHGPGELLHLLEANLHANGAISYLVGGPVSRMLVGVSTLALRLGISTTAKQTLLVNVALIDGTVQQSARTQFIVAGAVFDSIYSYRRAVDDYRSGRNPADSINSSRLPSGSGPYMWPRAKPLQQTIRCSGPATESVVESGQIAD